MTTPLYFEVTLQTDIILNQKAASEGPNATLDFIPGSNFLGIVAGALYPHVTPDQALQLFHSTAVRFGDAHLATPSQARSLKVPAAMFYPKLKKASQELYIQYLAPEKVKNEEQLKQCRTGFYDFTTTDHKAIPVQASKNFAIKSAHNRETRTSAEKQMYGYESLQAGVKLYFSVEVDDPNLVNPIVEALTQGKSKRVGRSRSAQFGLVTIKRLDQCYTEVQSRPASGSIVTIYADSRLIFINPETGLPHYQPEAKDFGVEGGKISWEKSQIRTFQYSPWNFQRQCFDTERCGFEKGSVIVIEGCQQCPTQSQYVGNYQNEGFGRVIYNPDILEGDATTGKTVWTLAEAPKKGTNQKTEHTTPLTIEANDSVLIAQLKATANKEIEERCIYSAVEQWKSQNERLFKSKTFASQWGTIRSIAMRRLVEGRGHCNQKFDTLLNELFRKGDGYLMHGVAEPNWEDGGRRQKLEEFIKKTDTQGRSLFPTEEQQCLALINLAAEMAKIYRKSDK